MTLYPLRFEPLLRRSIWGGRRLATTLGKPLPDGENFAESWELADYRDAQSIVRFGPLQGATLGDLCTRYGRQLLGTEKKEDGFPLLFKFIDAQHDLSVQVHPSDQAAAALNPAERGKTEAWVILQADPGSVIYGGLKAGIDRQRLAAEMDRGNIEACLHHFAPQVGDCILIPAGVVHAIGAGLLIAEIQQASDTTFRLHDWNRLDENDQSRPLHIQQALQVIDFEAAPVVPQVPIQMDQAPLLQQLVHCEKFVLNRYQFHGQQDLGGDGRFHIISLIQGQLMVAADPSGLLLQTGETCLIPAETMPLRLDADGPVTLLDMCLP